MQTPIEHLLHLSHKSGQILCPQCRREYLVATVALVKHRAPLTVTPWEELQASDYGPFQRQIVHIYCPYCGWHPDRESLTYEQDMERGRCQHAYWEWLHTYRETDVPPARLYRTESGEIALRYEAQRVTRDEITGERLELFLTLYPVYQVARAHPHEAENAEFSDYPAAAAFLTREQAYAQRINDAAYTGRVEITTRVVWPWEEADDGR